MKSLALFLSAVIPLIAATAGPTAADAGPPSGCASGPAAAAAARLIRPDAALSDRSVVAGFESALVLKPLIYPGVRHRLIRAGDLWCNATAFNTAWKLAGREGSALELAAAYAQVAAAPYFDGVRVLESDEVVPGIVALETHALTNGITASWRVVVDGEGVRHATWTATGFGVKPLVGDWEGITASPGVTRSYARSPEGSMLPLDPLLTAPADPELATEGQTADGFTIRINYAGTGYSPNAGQDTGVHVADYMRFVRRVTLDNYQEFYNWGFRKSWSSDVGIVHVDSSQAATCLACVFYRNDFNIHINTGVVQAFFALGFEYPDDKQAFASIIGHEMTHNWQNGYYRPEQNGRAELAWDEGIARFQETLHSYSGVSHQPKSLIYSVGREIPGVTLSHNSCNGWDGADREEAFANGPFTEKTYNACYFYLSWYPNHGTAGIIDWFVAMRDHVKQTGNAEVINSLNQASPGTFSDDLASFAQASLTGRGYAWSTPGETNPVRDWGLYLERFEPPTLMLGEPFTKTLRDGGLMARRIVDGGVLSMSSNRAGVGVYVIRDDGTTATRARVDTNDGLEDHVAAPAGGENVWLVAVYPSLGSANVTLRLDAMPE